MNATGRATPKAAMYRWHLRERQYEYVSREIVGITGFRAEELKLGGHELWMERIHPEDRARVATEVKAVLDGGRATVFYRFLRKDHTYCTLMEHLYVGTDGERRAYLDGVLRDMTGQLSVGPCLADRLGTQEVMGTPVRGSGKRRLAAGVGIAALLLLALGSGYLAGLRQAAWSRVGTAGLTTTPTDAQVASRVSKPGTATNSPGKKATRRARLVVARAASPQHRHQIVRTPAAPSVQPDVAASQSVAAVAPPPVGPIEPKAAPSVQPDMGASEAVAATAPPSLAEPSEETASSSFWWRVAHTPQPIAPDPPSFH